MEMHQVRYFLALCEERNFSRAAQRCGVAQPSLSCAIRALEVKLGGSLFDRGRANTRLTDLGILLRSDLAQVDRSAEDAKRKAAKYLTARSTARQPRAMEAQCALTTSAQMHVIHPNIPAQKTNDMTFVYSDSD